MHNPKRHILRRLVHPLFLIVVAGWIGLTTRADTPKDNAPTQTEGDAAIQVVPDIDGDFDHCRITPDGQHLLVLQSGQHRLIKVSLDDFTISQRSPRLASGLSTLAYSKNKQRILVGSAPRGYLEHRHFYNQRGTVQWLDAVSLRPVQPPHTIQTDLADLLCLEDGKIVAISGSGAANDDKDLWSILNETARGEIDRNIKHRFSVWEPRGVHTTTADGRIVISGSKTNQRVSVRYFGATGTPVGGLTIPIEGEHNRGAFTLVDHERYLMTYWGNLLRLPNHPHNALQLVGSLERNTGAVVSRELGVLALCLESRIELYRWPSLVPLRSVAITGQLQYPEAVGDSGVFFARRRESTTEARNSAGQLVRVDLAKFIRANEIQPVADTPAPLLGEATGLPATTARLPLRGELTSLHLSADGQSLLVFDAGEGKVHRLNRETLAIEASSNKLPYGSHNIAFDAKDQRIVVLCAPDRIPDRMEAPIPGQLIWLDALSLEQQGEVLPCPLTPRLATFDRQGNLYLAGEFDDNDSWQIRRLSRNSTQFKFVESGRGYQYLKFGPEGKTLFQAGGGINFRRIHDTPSATAQQGTLPSESRVAYMAGDFFFSHSGFYIASGAGGILQFNEKTDKYGKPLASLGQLTSMAGEPPLLLTGSSDGSLSMVRVPECVATAKADFNGIVTNLVFHPTSGQAYGLHWPGRYLTDLKNRGYKGHASADVIAIDIAGLQQNHPIE